LTFWFTDRKVLGSILALSTKGTQHEQLKVSPCEISFFLILHKTK
jgi:hypothetical protein